MLEAAIGSLNQRSTQVVIGTSVAVFGGFTATIAGSGITGNPLTFTATATAGPW